MFDEMLKWIFYILLLIFGQMMYSLDEEFDYNEVDDYMFKELIDSSDLDINNDEHADMIVVVMSK